MRIAPLSVRHALPLLAGLLLCATGAAPRVHAQNAALDALPGNTLAVFSIDDVSTLRASYAESVLGQLYADAAFDDFHEELDLLLTQLADEALAATGVDPFELADMVTGSVSWAMLEMNSKVSEGQEAIAMCLLVDSGENVDDFAQGVDRLAEELVDARDMVLVVEDLNGVDVGVLINPEMDDVEMRYGFVESMLGVTFESTDLDRDYFAEIIDGLQGAAEDVLSEAAGFRRSVAAKSDASLRVWMDFGGFLMGISEGLEAGGHLDLETAKDLGLFSLGGIGSYVSVGAGGMNAQLDVEFTGGGQVKDVLLAGVGDQSPELTKLIPADVSSSYSMDLDMASMFDAFLEVLMGEDPEMAREMITGMAEMESEVGFNPREDFMENLDGQMAFFATVVEPGEGMPFAMTDPPVNFALLMGLNDGEAMAATLDGVVRSQGLHAVRQLEEFEGYNLYVVPVLPGTSAAYAVTDDLLVLSMAPSLVKDVLRRKANPELPSIASSKDVQARLARLPRERTLVIHEDAAKQLQGALASIAEGLALMGSETDEEFAPFMGLLESLAEVDPTVVDKYYRGAQTVSTVTLSARGIHMESDGP